MLSVGMMLRAMRCLITVMLLTASVMCGTVIKSNKWIPMEKGHKIHPRMADAHGSYSHSSPSSAAAVNPVDLHNKDFCVDVSTYQPVVWVERDGEECKTDFVKQCEEKSENVCAEVTETKCEVILYYLLLYITVISS